MNKIKRTRHQVRLESLAQIDPETLSDETSSRFSFKYIDISSASNGRLFVPDEFIELANAPSRARKVVKNGDVIVSMVRPNLKAFAYCRLTDQPHIASTGFAVLRARENVDAYFLLLALLSDDLTKQIAGYAVGSNYPAISSSDVRRLLIPVFPPESQRAIGRVLTTIDQTIEKTEALIEKYQQIKAGLMHDLFTRGIGADGKLRPPREQAPELYQQTPIGWIPKEWRFKPLVWCNKQMAHSRFVQFCLSKAPFAGNVGHLFKNGNAAEAKLGGSEWAICLLHHTRIWFERFTKKWL